MAKQPLLLMILDGWGIAPAGQYNAAALAKTPNWMLCSTNIRIRAYPVLVQP